MHKLAIIADPHYHEIFPGYGFSGVKFRGKAGACIRTRADSAASTRIFNESWLALPAALDGCVAEGIRTVIIAGDLTDDGQIATMEAALALLARYEAEHGMRFFLTPGNHDAYGMRGLHQAKVFFDENGNGVTVTSDPDLARKRPGAVLEPSMFCRGYGDLAPLWARYGVQRRDDDIYWECPFGADDAFASRMFEMRSPNGTTTHRQLDLSYLVEPQEGLWLVSIDANVFEPRDGHPDNTVSDAFLDSTDAGWNALVRLKPFILNWLSDVAERARSKGKTLLCFSHYPVLDTYGGTSDLHRALFGETSAARRTPLLETGQRVAATGVGVHFSGHLHVSDVSTITHENSTLTNIAVPSIVAFPPAFIVAEAQGTDIELGYRHLDVEAFDAFFPFYRQEKTDNAWTSATDYGTFLYGHVRELVLNRFLPLEWPKDLAQVMTRTSVQDLFDLASTTTPVLIECYEPQSSVDESPSGLDLVVDWYAARMAGKLVSRYVSEERLALYRRLIAAFDAHRWPDPACLQSRIKMLLELLERRIGRQPAHADLSLAPAGSSQP